VWHAAGRLKAHKMLCWLKINQTASKGLHSIWISHTRRGFGRDHVALGKEGEVSIQQTVLSNYGNIYFQFLMNFTVVTSCTYVLCSKATDENKYKRLSWINQKPETSNAGEGCCKNVLWENTRRTDVSHNYITYLAVLGGLKWWSKNFSFILKDKFLVHMVAEQSLKKWPKCIQRTS